MDLANKEYVTPKVKETLNDEDDQNINKQDRCSFSTQYSMGQILSLILS